MIRSLYIRDYALIEELQVDFDGGLNIITGETGAGKSILIGALKMILGERASTELVRAGARKAVIEGTFADVESPRVKAVLEDSAIEPGTTLILRREITDTQSRAFINDSPATAQALRALASLLIDLHGQHEHQSLLRVDTHVEMLDSVGGLADHLEMYRRAYEVMEAFVRKRRELVKREQELRREKELIEFQIQEIDAVAPRSGEEEELEAEHRLLENAERLFESTARIHEMLYESEEAIYDRLVAVRNELQQLARIDGQFEEVFQEIRSAEIAVNEVAKFVQDYSGRIEFNPERLETIRERLARLHFLKKKYGGTLEAVVAHRKEIGETYELAANFEAAIRRIDEEIDQARGALSEAAARLSQARSEVADRVENAIVSELVDLGIAHASFQVRLDRETASDGWVDWRVDGREPLRVSAFPHGVDLVEFYISTNLGESPKPLAKVASGGEVSRIMLALKTILARSERLPILVFDEIDVGISGAIAQRVGGALRDLAGYHQIVAITHLPQIAAHGDVHYLVEKAVQGGRTRTVIRRLGEPEREREVAVLLSGAEVTESAVQSARELIGSSRKGRA